MIDEPELSVHPAMQRRILDVLMDESKTKQIIISTHSPYFISWESIINGACLIRTTKDYNGGIRCNSLNRETVLGLEGFLKDLNNPHSLGISANEIFFLDDRILLVEGQEDVVIYKKIAAEIKMVIFGDFFGWGTGGADKIQKILNLLKDLGYKKVAVIFDGDKKETMDDIKKKFPDYKHILLKENDVRDKPQVCRDTKNGISYQNGTMKKEYLGFITEMFSEINQYFKIN